MGSSFEDLEVWKKSCRLAVRLYQLLKECRDYGMKDQMLRASVSIASNIAEGSERNSIPDFQRFLNISKGSAAELRTQVYISSEVDIFSKKDVKELISELKSISKMLRALSNALNKNHKK
ncbi:MAG: four helix bundle protein [Bacteroidales bacterium]|nr:four helix bundle protein [Bacteroidales bacterium]